MVVKEQREKNLPVYSIEQWKPSDAPALYQLETLCWAPWLQKSEENIRTIAEQVPEIQLLLRNRQGDIVAALTMNRIHWDGNPQALSTWDAVAGGSEGKSNYVETYRPDDNTLCLMSMNVHPDFQGERLSSVLIEGAQQVAKESRVEHLISSFRPSGYGNVDQRAIAFTDYCAQTRKKDSAPIDPWLRSAFRMGMKPLRVEERAMIVTVSLAEFELYKQTYNPEKWYPVGRGTTQWACGETGIWFLRNNEAVYIEQNLWGEVPLYAPKNSLHVPWSQYSEVLRQSQSSRVRRWRSKILRL